MTAAQAMIDPHERRFHNVFNALSKVCGFEYDEQILEMYDRALAHYGYEQIANALEIIFQERSTRDPFPSVKDIKAVLEPKSDPEHEAALAAARIVEAVAKFGWPNWDRAKKWLTPLERRLIELDGGWTTVCEHMTDRNKTTFRAQYKNLALAEMQRQKLTALPGGRGEAPQLEHQPTEPEGPALTYGEVMRKAIEFNKDPKKGG